MTHPFELFADLVACLHLAVIAIDVWGATAVIRGQFVRGPRSWWHWLYLMIALTKNISVMLGIRCPLTLLENQLRCLSDTGFDPFASFVAHYLPTLPVTVDQVTSCCLLLAGTIALAQSCLARLFQTNLEPLMRTKAQ